MTPKRILLADDHGVVLEGLRRILDDPEFEIAGAVRDGRALIEAASVLKPDIIIADVSMPGLNGVAAAMRIRKNDPAVKIIFLTMHPEAIYAVRAMKAGGSAYVLKHEAGEELLKAIHEVEKGRIYITPSIRETVLHTLQSPRRNADDGLTARQREVLQLLAEGRTPKEIAVMLTISDRTVEFHKYRIMEILGHRTVAELVTYAAKAGLVG